MAVKKTLKSKKRSIASSGLDLYWSGFCFTDNTNFCQFLDVKVPLLGVKLKKFHFDKESLLFELDKEVTPVIHSDHIEIDGLFSDIIYYNLFTKNGLDVRFHRMKSFLSIPTENKILVTNSSGVPIGILMMHRKEEL